MKNMIAKLCDAVSLILITAVILVGSSMLLPKLLGYEVYTVQSGSMEPTYRVGSVVIVDTDIVPEEIGIGDPVTFQLEKGILVTHRIIGIDPENGSLQTKGDANEDPDIASVFFEQIIGKVIGTIPFVGYFPLYIRTPKGIFLFSIYICSLILLQTIPAIVRKEENDENIVEER